MRLAHPYVELFVAGGEMTMEVRVLTTPPSSGEPEQDYICVHTDTDPFDDTVVLATIERVTDRTKGKVKRVKTLIARQRMPADAALDLATSYAEWKQIPVVYADLLARQSRQ
jgi:hypothetical protein